MRRIQDAFGRTARILVEESDLTPCSEQTPEEAGCVMKFQPHDHVMWVESGKAMDGWIVRGFVDVMSHIVKQESELSAWDEQKYALQKIIEALTATTPGKVKP